MFSKDSLKYTMPFFLALLLGELFNAALAPAKASPAINMQACADGTLLTFNFALNQFQCKTPWNAFPTGAVLAFSDGSECPTGWDEYTDLNAGKLQVGTTWANADAGGTAGSSTLTATGTNSAPAFTGSSSNVSQATFTGTNAALVLNNHTLTTGAGLIAVGLTTYLNAPTSLTHSGNFTPAGTINAQTVTPQGSVAAPTFTGNAVTNLPASIKLVYCKRT